MRFIRTQAGAINESVSAGSELCGGLRPIFELATQGGSLLRLYARRTPRLAEGLRTQPRFHFLPSANIEKL